MSSPIRFQDHTAFHVQVVRVTLAGATLSLLCYLASLMTSLSSRPAETVIMTLAAALFGLAALPPARPRLGACVAALAIGLLGALGRQALAASAPGYPWFGVGVYGLAVGIIAGRDLRDLRRYLLPLATAFTMALSLWVTRAFQLGVNFAEYVPPFLAEPAYGALQGFLLSIALIGRQITVERDTVAEAYQGVRPTLKGEMLDLSERAVELYGRIKQVLRDRKDKGAQNETLGPVVEKLVMKIVHLGPKWNEVEREAGRTSAAELKQRIEGLEKKIADTSDEIARRQYRMACEALHSQLRYLDDISCSRERVIARVHNYLATLERLHLAVLNHRGADAAKFSDEVQPILDEIDSLGHEMDFASEAMREVSDVASEGVSSTSSAPTAPTASAAPAAPPAEPAASTACAASSDPAAPSDAAAVSAPSEPASDAESKLASSAFES